MDIKARMQKIVELKGYSPRRFEILIGASNGSFIKAIQNNAHISSKWLEAILFFFKDVNAEWLMRGKGAMMNQGPVTKKKPVTKKQPATKKQPVKKKKAARKSR